jgi:hypothetical protein
VFLETKNDFNNFKKAKKVTSVSSCYPALISTPFPVVGLDSGYFFVAHPVPAGRAALVRFGGKVYWWVDYRAAIGGKQYDAPASYTTTYRLKTSSS